MKKTLIAIVTGLSLGIIISLSANADLDKAIEYAQSGDIRKAEIELYKISQRAIDGNPKAMCEFGTMYKREGFWVVQSDKDAIEWWLKSAELGYAPCQFTMGALYLIGEEGVQSDMSKAKFWLYKAKESTYKKYARASAELYATYELDKY